MTDLEANDEYLVDVHRGWTTEGVGQVDTLWDLVAAELGDGWMPMFVFPDRLAGRAAELGRARRAAGLRSGPLTVAAGPWTVADADGRAARGVVAGCDAWYLSAMGGVYGRAVAGQGYGAAVEAIRAANPRPRPQGGTVPAEARVVLDELTAHGTPSQVRAQLARWDSVADLTMVVLPPGMAWDAVEATLRAAAPEQRSTRPGSRPSCSR